MKHKLCKADDVADNAMKSFEVDGEPVLVAKVGGEWYAIADMCTHAMAYLSEGELMPDSCSIQCPDHAAVFDLKTGDVLAPPAVAAVDTYPVTIEDGEVVVDIG